MIMIVLIKSDYTSFYQLTELLRLSKDEEYAHEFFTSSFFHDLRYDGAERFDSGAPHSWLYKKKEFSELRPYNTMFW